MSRIDEQMVNSIRVLSMDMIEKANSGHPGLPMGAAPMAFSLWKNHLKFNPEHQLGLTAIASFCQLVTVRQCFIVCYIYLVMIYQ